MTRKTIITVVIGGALLAGALVVVGSLRTNEPSTTVPVQDPVEAHTADVEGERDPIEEKLRAAEKRLGPEHPDLAPLLVGLADGRAMDGTDDVVALLERALHIQERQDDADPLLLVETLDMLNASYAMRQEHSKTVAVLKKSLALVEKDKQPVDIALALVRLATAHVHAGKLERAQPLVSQARRLIGNCESRGDCLGDELLADLTGLDFARVENALTEGDSAGAKRLMRDIASRAARDGGDPCDALVDVVFARVENLVRQCEQLARAGESKQADRAYQTVFRMLALAESAGACTELVDPYLVSDLTLRILRADLEAGRHTKARSRIEQLSSYARTHFDRGQLREMVRYDITDVVVAIAAGATGEQRAKEVERLQRFVLQLYASMNLGDTPATCEAVRAISELDLIALEEHLLANELDAAEELARDLRQRYDDHRIRACASQILRELALTFSVQARDASNRHDPASVGRLLAIARDLCRGSGAGCVQEIREAEQELQR